MDSSFAEGDKCRTIAMFIYNGVASSDVAGPLECFGLANYVSGRSLYRISTVSMDGEAVSAAGSWLGLKPNFGFESLPGNIDILLVPGGPAAPRMARDRRLLSWLNTKAKTVSRVGSICNGAFILGAAGLLSGGKATTHWLYASELARLYPDVEVEADAIFVRSGEIWSSGGMSAGMDLALAMIEADFGKLLTMEIARTMLLHQRRAGGQMQFSGQLRSQFADIPVAQRIQQLILDDPGSDLRIDGLAERFAMSKRTMLRVFKAATGQALGDFIITTRLRKACSLLETSQLELKEISIASGMGTEANMRRVFARRLGMSPSEYRELGRQNRSANDMEPRIRLSYDENWLHRTEVIEMRRRDLAPTTDSRAARRVRGR